MRKRDDEKQQRIKEAVMRLILEGGFAGTSISKIAKEADVSPATVYIYYDSKEAMLQDIYLEYSENVYDYMLSRVRLASNGAELISTMMQSYYHFINEHEEIFSFVDQFSHCPSLACKCSGKKSLYQVFEYLDAMKANGQIRNYSDEGIATVMFSPVKAICMETNVSRQQQDEQLMEVIEIIKRALLL